MSTTIQLDSTMKGRHQTLQLKHQGTINDRTQSKGNGIPILTKNLNHKYDVSHKAYTDQYQKSKMSKPVINRTTPDARHHTCNTDERYAMYVPHTTVLCIRMPVNRLASQAPLGGVAILTRQAQKSSNVSI